METLIMLQIARRIDDRLCVGIDLHKDTLTAVALDPATGEVVFTKLVCRCRDQIVEHFAALPATAIVAIESVGFYRGLWDLLEPIVTSGGGELRLADAT